MARAAKKSVVKANPIGANAKSKVLGAYKQMLTYQFGGALTLVVAMTVGLLICYFASVPLPLLLLVLLAGILGAFFSALTRLYNVDQASVALITPTVQALVRAVVAEPLRDKFDHSYSTDLPAARWRC